MKRAALALSLLLTAGGAFAADAPPSMPPPGYVPTDLKGDEAGIWMQVNAVEAQMRTAPTRVNDPQLNAYVRGVVCRLAADYCDSFRIYIMEVPDFNASMMPNGAMTVQTGLLLRTENEAQLAFVLGHEITHYLHRHTLDRLHRMVNATGAMAFISLAAAGAGVGALGSAINTGIVGALYANSRDQERDADQGGFDRGIQAGYDPRQAPAIWRYMAAETSAAPGRAPSMFLSTHPAPEERLATLEKQADLAQDRRQQWTVDADAFQAATAPFRQRWVQDQLSSGEPHESIVLFQRLSQDDTIHGLYSYALGESYRKRNLPGDKNLARAAYRAALACREAAPDAWRGLGLLAMKDGDKAEAREDFTQYRTQMPDARDKAMIDFYLTQL